MALVHRETAGEAACSATSLPFSSHQQPRHRLLKAAGRWAPSGPQPTADGAPRIQTQQNAQAYEPGRDQMNRVMVPSKTLSAEHPEHLTRHGARTLTIGTTTRHQPKQPHARTEFKWYFEVFASSL